MCALFIFELKKLIESRLEPFKLMESKICKARTESDLFSNLGLDKKLGFRAFSGNGEDVCPPCLNWPEIQFQIKDT